MSVSVTGQTGQLVQIDGGTLNGVTGLDLRTDGFPSPFTGTTITYNFSEPIFSVDFNIGHINTETFPSSGDKFTITALDTFGNTVYPSFTTSGSSYTANPATGVVEGTGPVPENIGVHFDDPDLISQVTVVWNDCDTCADNFHGVVIGEIDFCIPSSCCSSPEISINKTASPTSGEEGDTVTYTVVVENIGSIDVENVTLTDVLPSGVTYVAGSAMKTYPGAGTGSFTHNYGSGSFDTPDLTQSYTVTSSDVPSGATLVDYSFSTTGSSSDWLSDSTLTTTYPGGTAYTTGQVGSFGGNGSGPFTKNLGPKSLGGSAEGTYTFVWDDAFNGVGGDDNTITTASFSINYSSSGTTTDAAGTPSSLVTALDGITLAAGETMTVTYKVTADVGTEGTTVINTATSDADNLLTAVSDTANVIIANPCDPATSVNLSICTLLREHL